MERSHGGHERHAAQAAPRGPAVGNRFGNDHARQPNVDSQTSHAVDSDRAMGGCQPRNVCYCVPLSRRLSSMAEHGFRKAGVEGSTPSVGSFQFPPHRRPPRRAGRRACDPQRDISPAAGSLTGDALVSFPSTVADGRFASNGWQSSRLARLADRRRQQLEGNARPPSLVVLSAVDKLRQLLRARGRGFVTPTPRY